MENKNAHVNLDDIEVDDKEVRQPNLLEIGNNNLKNAKIISNSDNKVNDSNGTQPQIVEKFSIPMNLKRTFFFSVSLLIIGLTLFIIGFVSQVRAADPGNGITFWVLGSVVFIPGAYYSYQFFRAKRNLDNRREEILSEIPEL